GLLNEIPWRTLKPKQLYHHINEYLTKRLHYVASLLLLEIQSIVDPGCCVVSFFKLVVYVVYPCSFSQCERRDGHIFTLSCRTHLRCEVLCTIDLDKNGVVTPI